MSYSDTQDFQSKSNRRTYLVTYSQADVTKFPTRQSFGEAVAAAFNTGSGKVQVNYWACCLENHESTGQHYHISVKLSGPKRWNPVKLELSRKHNITVHFSESTENYYTAYRYVCKSDENVYHSDNHPDLNDIGSPQTKKCMKAYREKCKEKRNQKEQCKETQQTKSIPQKVRRLSNLDVSEFLIKHNIKSDTELFAKANEQKEAGKKELAHFVMARTTKSLQDVIETSWKMHGASAQLQRKQLPRMDLIRQSANGECIAGCGSVWLDCAIEVLQNNKIHPIVFAEAMRELLIKGRGKFRNILIVGPANCAKTFLLTPLTKIFESFSNPANDKYAWLGAEKAELIFLNDFRWSSEMIAWKELLLLLEGQSVHLPSPKNHYSCDICIDSDTPIVATGKSRITFVGKYNSTDDIENEMMAARWKVFDFFSQIPEENQRDLSPCPHCFSNLILMGEL